MLPCCESALSWQGACAVLEPGTGPCTKKGGCEQPLPCLCCGGDSLQRLQALGLGEGALPAPACVTHTCDSYHKRRVAVHLYNPGSGEAEMGLLGV